MYPILYESTETAFSSNGICRLTDIISCVVTEERNGVYECDFEFPVSGAYYDQIYPGRIIGVTHDDTGDMQPFDIVSYSRTIGGVVTFHAVHVSYRLTGYVTTMSSVSAIATAFSNLASANSDFSYSYPSHSTANMASADGLPHTLREFLGGIDGSILDTWGGEYEWNKWKVILSNARGETKDFTIRYGLNLTDYTEEVDYTDTYSAVIPYWNGSDEKVVGSAVSSGLSTYSGRTIYKPLDLSDKFESAPTTTQLTNAATSYMTSNSVNLPSQNITVDFVRLQDTPEYAEMSNLLECSLCDSVRVVFPMYDMSGTFKIVKTVWNVLLDRYDSMELGNLSTTLSEALGVSGGSSSTSSSTKVQSGSISATTVASGAYADATVTFGSEFSTTPVVVAGFVSESTGAGFGSCSCSVHTITTTGCKIRIFNNDSTSRAPALSWIARG